MGKIKSNFRKKDNESDASLIEKERYEILPKEEDEDTNPKIKLYNEMVRRAMTYETDFFPRYGVNNDDDLERIFNYVLNDYPENFRIIV